MVVVFIAQATFGICCYKQLALVNLFAATSLHIFSRLFHVIAHFFAAMAMGDGCTGSSFVVVRTDNANA